MKRNMACIVMLFSVVLISYSIKAYAEEPKPVKGSEFIKSYEGKNIKELIALLGKPNEVKEKRDKYAKPGFEVMVHIWSWDDINKLPVKIISDSKEGTTPHFVDFIKVFTEGGEITVMKLAAKNKFLIP